jgi:hypothetical protein
MEGASSGLDTDVTKMQTANGGKVGNTPLRKISSIFMLPRKGSSFPTGYGRFCFWLGKSRENGKIVITAR